MSKGIVHIILDKIEGISLEVNQLRQEQINEISNQIISNFIKLVEETEKKLIAEKKIICEIKSEYEAIVTNPHDVERAIKIRKLVKETYKFGGVN